MTNETMKTPVDFLREQYYESEGKLTRSDFEQAKEMEKEQSLKDYQDGYNNGFQLGQMEVIKKGKV